jgi:hypothetical protein
MEKLIISLAVFYVAFFIVQVISIKGAYKVSDDYKDF